MVYKLHRTNWGADMYLFSLGSESPKGAIGHIVPTEKTILAVEKNKVLLPPLWNRTFSWGFDDFSCCLGNYGSDKVGGHGAQGRALGCRAGAGPWPPSVGAEVVRRWASPKQVQLPTPYCPHVAVPPAWEGECLYSWAQGPRGPSLQLVFQGAELTSSQCTLSSLCHQLVTRLHGGHSDSHLAWVGSQVPLAPVMAESQRTAPEHSAGARSQPSADPSSTLDSGPPVTSLLAVALAASQAPCLAPLPSHPNSHH